MADETAIDWTDHTFNPWWGCTEVHGPGGQPSECDGCYAACPEQAIAKLGPGRRYSVEYDKCTGCAACFEQCPCHAIAMLPEAADA